MKLITRDTDYAIRALCCIAGSKKKGASVSELVKELNIPRPFLRKILQILTKTGLLESRKGKGGGFVLAADVKDINVFNLIEIFQGPFQLSEHIFKGKECPLIKRCVLKGKLDRIEKDVISSLKRMTVASLE